MKLCYQHSGEHLRAGEFFFREMHCLRRQMAKDGKPRWLRALWWFYEQVAGYGEWPGRVFVVMLLVVALSAALQLTFSPQDTGASWGFELTRDGWANFVRVVYFSLVTFTTLGYGDISPKGWGGQVIAGTEALLGMVLISLFLVCIVRKFSR